MAGTDRDPIDDTYTESQVILTAVKIIAPFTLTYGLFLAFHGADTPGGSFQGGAIVGVTVLMIAFAFGIEPTRQWLRNSVVTGLVTGGVIVFVGVGLATVALGGNFLEYDRFYEVLHIKQKWGMEAIEAGGIALIVSGVIITLFFATSAGFTPVGSSDAAAGIEAVDTGGGHGGSDNGRDDSDVGQGGADPGEEGPDPGHGGDE